MLRRCSIPIAILSLVISTMLAAGTASAAQRAHPGTTRIKPGAFVHAYQPGGPMDRAESGGLPGRRSSSSVLSTNWSGYAVTGSSGTFTSVSASWTEPTATCPGSSGGHHGRGGGGSTDQYAAFWVGLDGYSNDTVEQTGTDSDCDGTTPDYYGWYEMYPAGPVYFTNTMKAGDSISASVTFSGTDTYTLVLTDSTQGWTQTILETESGLARESAEVITEAPSSNSGVLPLADFNTVNYTTAADTEGSGASTSLGTQSPIEITMVDNSGADKDSTSSISSSGSFSNTWIRST
ncbi:MAG TPA: G1 family glutamic endopeptidase [Streptosporangiaceae bacterium]|nr:G1 family glutamic endopeptidase [Streptosporangiaceae bacterium]